MTFTDNSQPPPNFSTDPSVRVVEMTTHILGSLRTKIITSALVVSLVGGAVCMDAVASHFANEIGRTDRSARVLEHDAPSAPLRAASGVS